MQRRAIRLARQWTLGLCLLAMTGLADATPKKPVVVGFDGEYHIEGSYSAQAIELGLRTAIEEINAGGGVLGGHRVELMIKEHRSMSARGLRTIKQFIDTPEVVAVFGGRFSPVIIEQLPLLKAARLPFLAVWSSADQIIENGMVPNYIFRLSLRDSLAMPKMLNVAKQRGFSKVGLLIANTAWGRSNIAAAQKYVAGVKNQKIVEVAWFNWEEKSLVKGYQALTAAGAQAVLYVGNDLEGSVLVREVAALPTQERVPILSHWGVAGGQFFEHAGPALQQVDFSVIQTFSFFKADKPMLDKFMKTAQKTGGIERIEQILAPVGVAHAYDMMHILAKAINLAGRADRMAIRDALEKVPEHRGLVKHYKPPFTPKRHEALGPEQLLMARYNKDGVLVPEK